MVDADQLVAPVDPDTVRRGIARTEHVITCNNDHLIECDRSALIERSPQATHIGTYALPGLRRRAAHIDLRSG